MKKEIIRREFLKLKLDGITYKECQKQIEEATGIRFSIRTLKYWKSRFERGNWGLGDNSQRPNSIHYKFYVEDLEEVVNIRVSKGYSAYQIKYKLEEKGIFISESMIKKIVNGLGLSRGNKMQGQRLKWIRFERNTPNSMWQLDGTEFNGSWVLPVIDDCSRYCLGIAVLEHMTTGNVTKLLEELIHMHGKPREILTDNGPEYKKKFTKWCIKQGIKHIRSGFHKPTTVGKVSRIQHTIVSELPYCFNDLEYFRWRYNCDRPHRSLNGLTPNQIYFGYNRHKKYLLEKRLIIKGL